MAWRLVLCSLALSLLLASCLLSTRPFNEHQWRQKVLSQDTAALYLPHHQDGRFFNPWMLEEQRGFTQFLTWRLSAAQEYSEAEKTFLPRLIPDLPTRIEALAPEINFMVWLGHATFLMRIDGVFWLTDPMLSDRALLPKRVTPPALTKTDLSQINAPLNVIISHNHYDHLDTESLQSLPEQARIFVPLGLKSFVQSYHDGIVEEMDWWQHTQHDGVMLTCLPAQHWSRRIGQSRNATLWASYMIQAGNLAIYYGGDSGYFVGYREIGSRYPDIDYALLPTTAYHPRWFMHYAHLNVEEAVQAFEDMRADTFVPTQWGTFQLGDNPPGLPMLELGRLIKEKGLEGDRYARLSLGEIMLLAN